MALKTYQTRTLLKVLQRQSEEVLTVENKLTQELAKYFSKLEKQVQRVVEKNSDLPSQTVSVMVNLLLDDMETTYQELLYKYLLMTQKLSQRHTNEIITLQQKKRLGQKRKATKDVSFKELPLTWLSMKAQSTLDSFTEFINKDAPYRIRQNDEVHDYLRDHSLTVSESTRSRINNDIQEILTTSEKEGIGNKQVAQKIKDKFNQLETWEARRIARTEINAANNLSAHNELLSNDLVDYKIWIATSDNRTRDTHKEINGEITRIGNPFSNGLQYPGDHNGPLKEFINCRCRVAAWIPDYDKVPPTGMEHFREKDCVQLPLDESKQIMLQLPEDMKLFEVRDGYMKFHLDGLTVKPLHPVTASLITRLFDENGRVKVNVNNPLRKVKSKTDERFRTLFKKLDDNNVTVHTGRNLEKPVYVQNGAEVIKPTGINANEVEEFEKLYSQILDNVLEPKEQKALDKLMSRLKKNGGYVRVSQDGKVQVNWRGKFKPKERDLLRDLQQKRIDALMERNIKPTFSKPVVPPKPAPVGKPKPTDITDVTPENVWTNDDQEELDDLMAKLEINGGKVKIKGGKVTVEAGGFKGITHKEIKRLEELHNKKLKAKLHPVKNTPKPADKPKTKLNPTSTTTTTTKPRVNTGLTPELTTAKPEIPTNEVNKMSFKDLAEYYDVEYKGLVKYDYDGRKYHTFVEEVPGGKTLTIRMEEGAVKSYTKAGIASPQEILQEVMRVPKVHKIDTDEIWFKNTNQGIVHRFTKSGYDSLAATTGGYNTHYSLLDRGRKLRSGKIIDDPNHCIVINPKHFKGSKKDAFIWKQKEGHITDWKHTIRHEFSHSTDLSRERFRKGLRRASYEEDYRAIEREEPEFTWYANTSLEESYAEHGGYVSHMLEHPEEQAKKITIELRENGKRVKKDINFEDYKKMYPKHYEYFLKLYTGG